MAIPEASCAETRSIVSIRSFDRRRRITVPNIMMGVPDLLPRPTRPWVRTASRDLHTGSRSRAAPGCCIAALDAGRRAH